MTSPDPTPVNETPADRRELWLTSTAAFWRDPVTGQVFDLQPDEEYRALPADAVRLGDVSALRDEVERLKNLAVKLRSRNEYRDRRIRDLESDLRVLRAAQSPAADVIERTLEPLHVVMCPCGWPLADCRRELDPDELRDIARTVLATPADTEEKAR